MRLQLGSLGDPSSVTVTWEGASTAPVDETANAFVKAVNDLAAAKELKAMMAVTNEREAGIQDPAHFDCIALANDVVNCLEAFVSIYKEDDGYPLLERSREALESVKESGGLINELRRQLTEAQSQLDRYHNQIENLLKPMRDQAHAQLTAAQAREKALRDALEELEEIYHDIRIPGEIDSFTLQPARDLLAQPSAAPSGDSVTDTVWEAGEPAIFFVCTHGVFRSSDNASLCYTTSLERAQWIAERLNAAMRNSEGKAT